MNVSYTEKMQMIQIIGLDQWSLKAIKILLFLGPITSCQVHAQHILLKQFRVTLFYLLNPEIIAFFFD